MPTYYSHSYYLQHCGRAGATQSVDMHGGSVKVHPIQSRLWTEVATCTRTCIAVS